MPTRPWLRWLVPFAAVLAIAATTLVAGNASADEKLPPRSAEQLLVDLQQAEPDGFSGTVQQSADLGIPALPGMGEQGSDFSSLISGTHTLRVAYASPDKSKVALLGDLSESSVIRNGSDVWTWSSSDNAVTHATIDAVGSGREDRQGTDRRPQDPSGGRRPLPDRGRTDHAGRLSRPTRRWPGGAAYELVLTPKQTGSLLSSVRIAVDGTEHVALRVQVFAGDRADPVAAIGFTEVDFTTPADSVFAFTPPKGAEVTEVTPEDNAGKDGKTPTPARRPSRRSSARAGPPSWSARCRRAICPTRSPTSRVASAARARICRRTWLSCPRCPAAGGRVGCWPAPPSPW